ncbi:hypothetical protein GCM10010425_73780 [Streptomyces spororaveus]|uniref:Uncharacterized protein n=1 Tax=Streptomyces spororaveus TaxID=284039 RepID=A0ABQ3TK42_9ACTN|nr:hypothetical protein Sspor_59010 [Streptomyces spororaveus]
MPLGRRLRYAGAARAGYEAGRRHGTAAADRAERSARAAAPGSGTRLPEAGRCSGGFACRAPSGRVGLLGGGSDLRKPADPVPSPGAGSEER